jgi:hypothetical protein
LGALFVVVSPAKAQEAADGAVVDSAVADGGSPPVPAIAADQLPEVTATLDRERVELGEVVRLQVTLPRRAGEAIHVREVRELGAFELVGRQRHEEAGDGLDGGGDSTLTMTFELISFETGQVEVPPLPLTVILADGRTGEVTTPALAVEVTDPLANEPDPQPRADHPPRVVRSSDQRGLWAAAFLAALGLALFAGVALGRVGLRKKERLTPPPPPRPPEEVALEKLAAAEGSDWLESGEIKRFHVAVSEAVREYLGGRFGFDSLEQTTVELLREMEGKWLGRLSRDDLEEFLRETDMVKFAKWRPEVERSQWLLARAYEIVRRTTAAPPAGASPPATTAAEAGGGGGADEA